jgi:hypothetical protein
MVNASMMGKSRAFAELPNHGIFVTSVCFQSASSGNVPLRTGYLGHWFLNCEVKRASELKEKYQRFLIHSIVRLIEFISESDEDLTLPQLCRDWSTAQSQGDFWYDFVQNYSHSVPEQSVQLLQTQLVTLLSNRFKINRASKLRLLFFFDEASKLTEIKRIVRGSTRFDILRRALKILFTTNMCMFSFVTDTASNIADLAPAAAHDRSQTAVANKKKLYPAFWWIPTMDIWPTCDKFFTVASLQTPVVYCDYGRPAFGARMRSAFDEEEGASELLLLLQNKIFGGELKDDSHCSLGVAMAVLSIRTALTVSAACHVASLLSASHMRQIVGISEDRDSVFTYQYAEPAMAFAVICLTLGSVLLLAAIMGFIGFHYKVCKRVGLAFSAYTAPFIASFYLIAVIAVLAATDKFFNYLRLHKDVLYLSAAQIKMKIISEKTFCTFFTV